MLIASLWGLIATSSLVLGGLLALRFSLGKRTLGMVMAFGAGSLLSAVAYELTFEAIKLARGSGYPALGFMGGASVFLLSEQLVERIGAGRRKAIDACHASNLVAPMVLAIILDGIPEAIVLGLGILEDGKVSLAMLAAIFISNIPEAIAGTSGMRSGGWNRKKILVLWFLIAVICGFSCGAGYELFAGASRFALAFIQAFAGGAILMMLANTMMPEAYEHGGKLAGVFTVLGFAVSVFIILLESAQPS